MLTPTENLIKLFQHEETEYLPLMGEGIINNVPVNGYQERPFGGKGCQHWFGVHWFWKEGEPAPMPVAPYLLEDICEMKLSLLLIYENLCCKNTFSEEETTVQNASVSPSI